MSLCELLLSVAIMLTLFLHAVACIWTWNVRCTWNVLGICKIPLYSYITFYLPID